jgi:putative transposase
MPWIETEPMDEKTKFISAYLNKHYYSFQELCERFNITTKTGYKYVNRYGEYGVDGLKELSRAPINPSNRMPGWIETCILDVKHQYPFWGGKKILNWLLQKSFNALAIYLSGLCMLNMVD